MLIHDGTEIVDDVDLDEDDDDDEMPDLEGGDAIAADGAEGDGSHQSRAEKKARKVLGSARQSHCP